CKTMETTKVLHSNQNWRVRSFGLYTGKPIPIRAMLGKARKTAQRLPTNSGVAGITRAVCVGAMTVRVLVAELPPGVTDAEDREQDAAGVDPVTPQVSCTALVKEPFIGAMVTTSVIWPPRWIVRLAVAGVREKSGGGPTLNVAVTFSPEVMVMLQLVPEQAPLQPENVDPEAGEAVKTTTVPTVKFAVQEFGQSIPAGLLVTCPLPLPVSVTKRVNCDPIPPSITVTLLLPAFATYILFVCEFTAKAIGPTALESVTVTTERVVPSITDTLLLPQFAT